MSIRRGGFQTRPVLFKMRIAAFARQALQSRITFNFTRRITNLLGSHLCFNPYSRYNSAGSIYPNGELLLWLIVCYHLTIEDVL